MEIATMLENKGATCTQKEIDWLGNKYSNFLSVITISRGVELNQHNNQIEVLVLEIEQLNKIIREKNRIIAQKQTIIQEKQSEVNELKNTIQEKNKIIREKDKIIRQKEASIQQMENKMEREEVMQRQLWKSKQNQVQQISNFQDLQMISKIAHGCDAVVFNCSALQFGIPSVALKILFNLGINTSHVSAHFENEFAILKALPFHPNIIPIWKEFLDRPTQTFLDFFPPDLKALVANERTGVVRSTTCILMPILECFEGFFNREFKKLGVSEKLSFIADIMSGLLFLEENNVVHRDMKLNNLLINSSGRIIISDFGSSIKLLPDKTIHIPPGGSIGGNPVHLAPEIRKTNTSRILDAVKVDYSKQASFELGMVAFEIFFGDIPESHKFGEHMDDAYFNNLCCNDLHKIPEMYAWLRGLLHSDPQRRTALLECAGSNLFDPLSSANLPRLVKVEDLFEDAPANKCRQSRFFNP